VLVGLLPLPSPLLPLLQPLLDEDRDTSIAGHLLSTGRRRGGGGGGGRNTCTVES